MAFTASNIATFSKANSRAAAGGGVFAARMAATNADIRDYYILPGLDMTWENLRLAEFNGVYLDIYRFDTLEYFLSMAERVKLEELI